jgi:hypothetical protein
MIAGGVACAARTVAICSPIRVGSVAAGAAGIIYMNGIAA